MMMFRWIVMLLLIGSALSFAMFIGTQDRRLLNRGLLVLKWTVIAGLAFFAVLLLERMAIAI
mgnify:FL=1